MTAIHQFVKVGTYAFVGGKSGVKKDVPPFTRGEGMPYRVIGLNSVGLRRAGFSNKEIDEIKSIYRIYYQQGMNFSDAKKYAENLPNLTKYQKMFIDFSKKSERGLCK
jgi:UDP-N-acetylglucosamine acyltransferase